MNNQDKKDRFKRLATTRTNDILKKLRILSNCSNRSAYEYSEDDVNKIFSAIDQAMKESKSKFYFPKNNSGFKL